MNTPSAPQHPRTGDLTGSETTTTRRRVDASECPRCGQPVPVRATGRPAKWCSQACRRAAYEERRAAENGAIGVEIVDRVIVETHETVIDNGHSITGCVTNVTGSPRACANIITHLAAKARRQELLDNNQWAPVVAAIQDLYYAIADPPPHRYRR